MLRSTFGEPKSTKNLMPWSSEGGPPLRVPTWHLFRSPSSILILPTSSFHLVQSIFSPFPNLVLWLLRWRCHHKEYPLMLFHGLLSAKSSYIHSSSSIFRFDRESPLLFPYCQQILSTSCPLSTFLKFLVDPKLVFTEQRSDKLHCREFGYVLLDFCLPIFPILISFSIQTLNEFFYYLRDSLFD